MHGTCWDSWCRTEFSSSSLWPHIHDKTQETWDTIPRDTGTVNTQGKCRFKAHTALFTFSTQHPKSLLKGHKCTYMEHMYKLWKLKLWIRTNLTGSCKFELPFTIFDVLYVCE